MSSEAERRRSRADWRAVDRRLSARRHEELSASELDELATARFWANDPWGSVEARQAAHLRWLEAGDDDHAIRSAWFVFYEHWLVGEVVVARGWLARARRLLSDPGAVITGWVALAEADVGAAAGELDTALDHARSAVRIGRRSGDRDLLAMGLQNEGRQLLALGRSEPGFACLDEAMVAVIGDELDPMFTGWIFCNVIAACHATGDLRRATEWSEAALRWCAQLRDGLLYPGLCRVYAAQLAQLRGDWGTAERHARQACDDLLAFDRRYAGAAHYVVGELCRLRGHTGEAERFYRRAHELGHEPQPGLALLRAATGHPHEALGALRTTVLLDPPGGDGSGERRPNAALLPALEHLGAIIDVADKIGDTATLVAAADITVADRDLFTPRSDLNVTLTATAEGQGFNLVARSDLFRLQDLYPLARLAEQEQLLPEGLLGETKLPTSLRGELSALNAKFDRRPEREDEFSAAFDFSDLGTSTIAGAVAFSGLSGSLRADQGGGNLQVDARETRADLPALFKAPIDIEALNGLFVWHVTADRVRVLSDDIRVQHRSATGNSRLELIWPLNDESPRIDLTATAVASDGRGVLPLLPQRIFPTQVNTWLDNAILAGRVTNADFEVSGLLRQFPFTDGQGVFRIAIDIENGVLNYADQWPRITDLDATVVFEGPGLYSLRNSGRIGPLEFADSSIRLENFGKGLLEVDARQRASLEDVVSFLQRSPVAGAIGPLLADVTADGNLDAAMSLELPVLRPNEFKLVIEADTEDADLGLTTLDWGLTNIRGALTVNNTRLRSTGITATLLEEPVTIDLIPAGRHSERYEQFIRINGRTPVERWMQTLSLPFADQLDGPTDWQALVMIPRGPADSRPPVHILTRSSLEGVHSRLPAPLTKSAETRRPLEIDIAFPANRRLDVSGRLLPALNWTFALAAGDEGWRIERGGVHAGPAPALLPVEPGVELSGRLAELNFDDWLAVIESGGDTDSDWQRTWHSAELVIGRLELFEQSFDAVQVAAGQSADAWQIRFDAESIAGDVSVPFDLESGGPVVLDLTRLRLSGSADEDYDRDAQADPRELPALEVQVEDFEINDMRFGSLETTITKVIGGVEAKPIITRAPAFSIDGDAAWLVNPNDDALRQTHLSLSLRGSDIKAVLTSLGYDPVIDGDSVSAGGELTWLGGPSGDFLWRADGSFSIRMEDGALLDLEPGGGRILGVLSLATLPRRLSFDFSDVIDDGLAFDSLGGDFTLDDGNAYTCNLSLEGPVADMGIVGRAGFEPRDYDQIAVIRPHVSTLFAAGGFVVGGPVAGAAMLLFSQIFQKPLSTLGESYHSVTGTWDEPVIEQLRGNDIDSTPLRNCETFLSEAITESLKE